MNIAQFFQYFFRRKLDPKKAALTKTNTQLAPYADDMCKGFVDSKLHEVNKEMLRQIQDNRMMFHIWNLTSVGNICYVAEHASDELLRQAAAQLMEKYRAWCRTQQNEGA